jgi:hypothetical protein
MWSQLYAGVDVQSLTSTDSMYVSQGAFKRLRTGRYRLRMQQR